MRKDCVVHVPTQNDWDYVTKELGYVWIDDRWSIQEHASCININGKSSSYIGFYKRNDFIVLSMDEFKLYLELQKKFFSYYDELSEPYQSKAKNNWDFDYCKRFAYPKKVDIRDSLRNGFYWKYTPEGHLYWENLDANLENNLKSAAWVPEKCELVDVQHLGKWLGPYEFIATIEGSDRPHIVMKDGHVTNHKRIRLHKPKIQVTLQDIANWKQCDVDRLDVQLFPRNIQDCRVLTIQELADLLKEMTNEL